jgi:hypothetical protein
MTNGTVTVSQRFFAFALLTPGSFAVYSFPGLLTAMLLFICFATLIKSTPILRRIFLSEKKGFWGTFYKGAPSFSKNHHHHKLFFFFSNLKSIHPTSF